MIDVPRPFTQDPRYPAFLQLNSSGRDAWIGIALCTTAAYGLGAWWWVVVPLIVLAAVGPNEMGSGG